MYSKFSVTQKIKKKYKKERILQEKYITTANEYMVG
jgi:hypothetical protein